MRGKRFTTEQIIGIVKELESGQKPSDTARKHGVHENTLYRWKNKYSGMEISDAKKMKMLEEENRKLKRLVAEQALDILVLKDVCSKKW